jgi:hypothetical protein
MKFKELIYRRAVLIGEGYTTDAELDYMWQNDQDIAWKWFDELWATRAAQYNREAAALMQGTMQELDAIRPAIIKAVAPGGGWRAGSDKYLPEATAEANKYRVKSAREVREWWERRRANVKI